jgi:hypothetical protein
MLKSLITRLFQKQKWEYENNGQRRTSALTGEVQEWQVDDWGGWWQAAAVDQSPVGAKP